MISKVEFHFDFGSPNAYLCHRVLPDISSRTQTEIRYVPILLGGIFKATNNRSPMEQYANVRNKKEYLAEETQRFLSRHNITDFKRNPHFPVNTLMAMRGAVFAMKNSWAQTYTDIMYQAMWEEERNIANLETFRSILENADLPALEIIEACNDPEIKKSLIESSMNSVERGNFGSPTFFAGDVMFFGKDSLEDFERQLISQATAV
jgi:2-hydroxychromene-2-carboxylate isomerase